MGEKLYIGNFSKGFVNNRSAFNIDNDAFPMLLNAYQWRGRIKRKRGTEKLGRLNQYIGTTDGSGNATITINTHPIQSGIASFVIGTDVFYDPGTASPVTLITNSSGSATLNRSTGVLTVTGSKATTAIIYYPGLPVMGLEDFYQGNVNFPGTIAFDTVYAYNISTTYPNNIRTVSFFNNPATATYTGYTAKSTWTPATWSGNASTDTYQQFWSTNYQGAMWATNGIDVPFTGTYVGLPAKAITTVDNITTGPPAFADLTITGHGLVVGDFVFINEVQTTTGINWQTGYVTAVVSANKVTVEFPNATINTSGSGGVCIYLTNTPDATKDCMRWYNGDPTNDDIPTTFVNGQGWVNFCPPISQSAFSIGDEPAAIYYLVTARMVLPFKDRLCFFGPVIQSKSGSPIYLQDTVIYSQNGTPFYTASFTSSPIDQPTVATTVFHPILVPTGQTATPCSYFSDVTGFGGFVTAGLDQPITTVSANEDVLILGFNPSYQVRFVYTGNDIVPFNFFVVNSELGSASTFSAVTMDKAVISRGPRGFTLASQVDVSRFDLEIPDQVFEISLTNNGNERLCAARDFINEWIYFTYPSDTQSYVFPNQTLLYNYRDNSWAIFNEAFTTYGVFRRNTGTTWAQIGDIYKTWSNWNDPWDSGSDNLLQPLVIAGNQQGYIIIKGQGTGEEPSLAIQNMSTTTVTSTNHCLNEGDYIRITDCQGSIANTVNGKIFQVQVSDANTFTLVTLDHVSVTGTYLGGGEITRLYVPQIQSKQFPTAWGMARKTRLGPQQYLFSTTDQSQITLLIFLSQNSDSAYNEDPIYPDVNAPNDSCIYSTVLYTCPESTNLGLTPANVNLQMPTAQQQSQIWHRKNTSLLGDTVQIGFTISRDQMGMLYNDSNTSPITGATKANPCVLTCAGGYAANQLITISGVSGMTELNGNTYSVKTSDATTVTINVDSSGFTDYVSGGTVQPVSYLNPTAEIVLHAIVLDVQPSQMLA